MNNEEKILALLMEMQTELKEIKAEQKAMKEEQRAMKEEQRAMKEEQRAMKAEQKSMKEELSNLKGQVAENTSILKAVEHRGEVTSAELQGFKMEMFKELGEIKAEARAFKEETMKNFAAVNEKLEVVAVMQERIDEHEWEIRKIKKRQIS
ncbi:MAG: hypothetical protein ACI3ZR_08675 [bacterium]